MRSGVAVRKSGQYESGVAILSGRAPGKFTRAIADGGRAAAAAAAAGGEEERGGTGYCGGMKPINSETGIKLAITSTSMGVPFHISMLNIEVLYCILKRNCIIVTAATPKAPFATVTVLKRAAYAPPMGTPVPFTGAEPLTYSNFISFHALAKICGLGQSRWATTSGHKEQSRWQHTYIVRLKSLIPGQ
ncbi:hypothetical protein T492DRAFT_845983 [Pavlovales sp. CCMP2436]|nr:hypothetical protein T492DRAFT_845983 [Pavlovales sp. CCMP2436]